MKTTEQPNQPKQQIIKGTLMTLFAGIAWGMSGACGQYLMAHGMGVLALTDLRLIISGVCLLTMSYVFTREQLVAFFKEKKNYAKITLFAFIGLFMNQFTYLEAFTLVMPELRQSCSTSVRSLSGVHVLEKPHDTDRI